MLMLLALAIATVARAQSVDFDLKDTSGWVGTPLTMLVQVNDLEDGAEPVVDGDPVNFDTQVVAAGSSQTMNSINGRVTRRSTRSFRVEFTPKAAGTFTLPTVTVRSGDKTWKSGVARVTVAAKDDSAFLRLEVRASPQRPWVGQLTDVTLRVLLKPVDSPQARSAIGANMLWKVLDAQRSRFGAFNEALVGLSRNNALPEGHEETIDGRKWLVYEVEAQVTPDAPGPIPVGDVRVSLNYPLGLRTSQDFFGDTQLVATRQRPVDATASSTVAQAVPLPDAGRPASFRGAVGRFAIDASAKPVQVAAGDPVTLTVTITSLGTDAEQMKTLQPPPIDAATLGPMFRVPSDPLAGTVRGGTKTFTQTIRPTSPDVTAIPPIEFSFFDPERGTYASVRSSPIALSVSPSERVNADRIERSATAPAADKPATKRTAVEGGLVANVAPSPDLLSDGRANIGAGTAIAIAAPPLLAAIALLARRRRDRLAGDAGLARSVGALRVARAALATADGEPALCAALLRFVADRTSHAVGTVTRGQAMQLAEQAGADDALRARLDRTLSAGERAAFAPSRGGDVAAARAEAESLLVALDGLRWRRRAAETLEVAA